MTTSLTPRITLEEIRTLVAEIMDIDEEALQEEAHFVEDLDMDSLMALEIMVALEKRYRIKLHEEELKHITCLKNVQELLEAKQVQGSIQS